MSNQSQKTKRMVLTGVMAAMSIILYFIELPIIPGFPHLKIDFSDLFAAVAGVIMGPLYAVAVELCKVIIHLVFKGFADSMGYGDLINFIVGCALTVPLSIVTRAFLKKGSKQPLGMILAGLAGLVSMVAAGVIANYLIAPLFFDVMMHVKLSGAALWGAISGATVLNLIKSAVTAILIVPITAIFKNRLMLERKH